MARQKVAQYVHDRSRTMNDTPTFADLAAIMGDDSTGAVDTTEGPRADAAPAAKTAAKKTRR